MDSNYTPMPIYKRPKEDDKEMKESSLKPQQYLSSKTHPLPKGAVPDLNLFQNMEIVEKCKGFSTVMGDDDEIESEEQSLILCPVLKRLVAVLNYYNSLMMSAKDRAEILWQTQFIEFCDEHYGEYWMMEDHMHFITNHSDLKSTTQIATALDYNCFGDLKRCRGTARHYRNRQRNDENEVHFYIDIMDSLHFNVLHLVDAGLRVNIDWILKNQEIGGFVDENILKMNREIQMKRQQTAFPRIEASAKSGKFSLCSSVESNDGAKGGVTKMDSVLKDFKKEVGDDATVHRLVEFMEEQRYDTETMNEDMAVYAESKQCNVRMAMEGQGDGESFGAIRRWLRYHRISASSFSTGIWWAYWPWYRTQTIESLTRYPWWQYIDFGGHSMKSLCVYPHFENLKEEVFGSGLFSRDFWTKLFDKATRYMQSSRCKKMIDKHSKYDYMKFGIPKDFKVKAYHLVALLLYTDSSEYCTALSETFRAIKSGETIEEMNGRNSMYYWTSRYLRELVFCFGEGTQYEKRPFYTGISYEMSIPQFNIGLIGPTSTSMAIEVACRFAGVNGMMIVIRGIKGTSSKYFDASVFSAYPEEQERIFFGNRSRDTVKSIILVKSARNYEVAIGAYSKFAAMFSGNQVHEMSALEMEIIMESLRWIKGGDEALNHHKLDTYILETFYAFVIKKKMVYLKLGWLNKVKNKQLVNMVMKPLWDKDHVPESSKPLNANLMKPWIFSVFTDVCQIRISAGPYPFDLLSFLSMLQSVERPETLEIISIDAWEWIETGFTGKVQEEYAMEGIKGQKRLTGMGHSPSGKHEIWLLSLQM